MKTSTPPAATAPTLSGPTRRPDHAAPSRRRARRLAAAGAVLSLAALGACSTDDPVTTGSSSNAGATTPATTATGTSGTSTASSSVPTSGASSSTTAVPARVDKAIDVDIEDDVLGHDITAVKLSRNIPWPAGNPVAAASFEIVGVQVEVDAGDRYSADVQPSMFTLKPASSTAAIAPTAEFGTRFGAPLATAKRGEKKTGWLFFKVDRGSTGRLDLTFNRPAYEVSTTDKAIKAAAFSAAIG